MVRTEGKKRQGNVLEETGYAPDYNCPKCGAVLVQLETETGKPFSEEGEVYYNLYWICLCPKGHGKFRVREATYKMCMDGK